MTVGYNAQILADAGTGVARFAEHMVSALAECIAPHKLVVFGNPARMPAWKGNVEVFATGTALNSAVRRIAWEQTVLPRLVRKAGIDVMYYPDHTGPLFGDPFPFVLTVHDMAPFALPELMAPGRGTYKRAVFGRSVRRASAVVADSQSTRDECIRFLGISPGKITVNHLGIDEEMVPATDPTQRARVAGRYGVPGPYILSLCTLERRKNLVFLIRAFARLKKEYGILHTLVLAGEDGYGAQEIREAATASNVKNDICFPGFVHREDLAPLYSFAELFVYPSLYEGFGFPPLEAMRCGCPVIASNTTSLPEVVGDAGILLSPTDEPGWVTAMHRILTDGAFRQELVGRGGLRARRFSWKASASRLRSVLETVHGGNQRSGA